MPYRKETHSANKKNDVPYAVTTDCDRNLLTYKAVLRILSTNKSKFLSVKTDNYQTVYFILGTAALLGAGSVFFIRRRGK